MRSTENNVIDIFTKRVRNKPAPALEPRTCLCCPTLPLEEMTQADPAKCASCLHWRARGAPACTRCGSIAKTFESYWD